MLLVPYKVNDAASSVVLARTKYAFRDVSLQKSVPPPSSAFQWNHSHRTTRIGYRSYLANVSISH